MTVLRMIAPPMISPATTVPLEYHSVVKGGKTFRHKSAAHRSIPASRAVLVLALIPLLFSSIGFGQVNGLHPSVTSPGFGGRAINGTPPSVTSLGRNGFTPRNNGGTFSSQSRDGHHHHHQTVTGNAFYPYVYALPVPYAMDMNEPDSDGGDEDDPEYQGGPTVFDSRGSGRDSYVPPSYSGPAHSRRAVPADTEPEQANASNDDPAPSEPSQPATTLVFRDGHQVEVENYAIVSQTLYDLTPGHPRKIALADLDLSATQKENDDRGVAFQLPPSAQAN